jgi:hypothetical protein
MVCACGDNARPRTGGDDDSSGDAASADAPVWISPDAAPPPFDAGPPPVVTCHPGPPDAAMQCELPASVCLDPYYLVYYTGGTCVDNKCQYETHWLYCYAGCWAQGTSGSGAGCSPGFT